MPFMVIATGRSVSQQSRQSTSPLTSGAASYWVGTMVILLMSTEFSVHTAWRTGVLAVAMPIFLPSRSFGVFTGFFASEAMAKGFFCMATAMILNFAPSATAAAV